MATVAPTSVTQARSDQAVTEDTIRPFHMNVPEAELTELRRRITEARWPDRERAGFRSLR